VNVDADKINEVIGNLISNAIKYTEKGFVCVKLLQSGKEKVRFEVVDTGPGISKEETEKLFQKFYRVQSNVGKTTGTGLGLYISRLMIEKFGGKIGVESEVGKGSTFWFEIPLSKD
jgi:signal transduction histidine kinase